MPINDFISYMCSLVFALFLIIVVVILAAVIYGILANLVKGIIQAFKTKKAKKELLDEINKYQSKR